MVAHWNGAVDALGVAAGSGEAVGDATAEALGLGRPAPMGADGRRSGLAMNRTPTISTAMTAAATAAIQYGPRAAGACVTA